MEYMGLFACYLVCIVLVGAAFAAWFGIRREIERLPNPTEAIRALEGRVSAGLADAKATADKALAEAAVAAAIPSGLKKRIEEAEAVAATADKKAMSAIGQAAALKRWALKEEEPAAAEAADPMPLPLWPAHEEVAAPAGRNFGKVMRKG